MNPETGSGMLKSFFVGQMHRLLSPLWSSREGLAVVCLATIGFSCATTSGGLGGEEPAVGPTASIVIQDLEPGRFGGLAASQDGRVFLAEATGWRLLAYGSGTSRLFEVSLPSARCLLAGGQAQGFSLIDQVGGAFNRYEQNGDLAFSASIFGHRADAFYLSASGESVFLDADRGVVIFRDQAFRETRRWMLWGRGHPQSLAADMLEGLVVVAYPGEARFDAYSIFGVMLDSRPVALKPGPQTLAFDSHGKLWAALAGDKAAAFSFKGRRWLEAGKTSVPGLLALAPGPGGAVMALGESAVFSLEID